MKKDLVISPFMDAANRYPDKTAIIYLGRRFSYGELLSITKKMAGGLTNLGVRHGDKVMIYLPNCPQFIITLFATQLIGAVPVPVSPIYTPRELEYLIRDSSAGVIVCLDTNIRYVAEVSSVTKLRQIIVTTYVDMLPIYKKIIGFLFDKVPSGRVWKAKNVLKFKELLKSKEITEGEIKTQADDLCYILYTGGTTGFPKGCISTHKGMRSFVNDIEDATRGHISDGNDTFIMVNPLFHQLAQGMLLGLGLNRGNTTVLMPIPLVDAILHAIERYKVTLFLGAPTLYRMILENDRLSQFDLSSLRFCWSGGDVMPLEVWRRFKELFNIPIRQAYGATEVGFVAMSPMDREPNPGSVGRPLPSRMIKIVDPDTLSSVPQGEVGELLVGSDFVLPQYWNKPKETALSYVNLEGRIWYRTSDFVRLGEDGELYYMDRGPDIIKYKAYRVSCSEIEAVLQDHPAVVGACVVGVPDPKVGERIKAMVVLKEDVRGVSGTELIKWCRERLASYKVPHYVEFRDMLPKSKVGKLLRREIREEERRKSGKG